MYVLSLRHHHYESEPYRHRRYLVSGFDGMTSTLLVVTLLRYLLYVVYCNTVMNFSVQLLAVFVQGESRCLGSCLGIVHSYLRKFVCYLLYV